MITSEDVRRVTFEKAMRGYRCDDVDDYLRQVAESMDALSSENEELQKKLVVLAQRIDQYRAEEDTLHTTLINAQRLGENIIKEAKQKAAEVIRAANIRAEDREQRARDEVELAHQELTTIHKETTNFKKSLFEMYRRQIQMLQEIPADKEDGDTDASAGTPAPAAQAAEPAPVQEEESYQTTSAPQYETPPAEEATPVYDNPPAYEEPAPAPAPAAEPEPDPEPAPYYDPEEDAQDVTEEKVDTVEFAIAPKPDQPQDLREDPPAVAEEPVRQNKFKPGAGLYDLSDEDTAPAPKKTTRKSSSTRSRSGSTGRRSKKQAQPDTDLPASFDTFAGVDFDS